MDTLLLNLAYISYVIASLLPSGLKLRLLNRECSQALQDAMALDITRKLRDETASKSGTAPGPGLE